MRTPNLWNDVDALARLALSERGVSEATRGGHEPRSPLPKSAFPPFCDRQDFEIHTVESPARVVSGDYCDAFLLSEGTLAVVMADVSGKGVPAALLKGILRSMIRNVSTFSASPGDTLTRVNRMLYEAHLGPMYVTIFLGWYNTRIGTLRYANAGHPHPYLIDREGRASKFGEVFPDVLIYNIRKVWRRSIVSIIFFFKAFFIVTFVECGLPIFFRLSILALILFSIIVGESIFEDR